MPASSQRRIAIFGTFDVENYGDLLFPLIAQNRLAEAGTAIVAVSPTANVTRYRDTVPVLSLDGFARAADTFDGILIGGGNIVHLRDFGLPGYGSTAYPSLWAGASAHAVRHGLPIVWNAPGVLAPESLGHDPDWAKRVTAAADRFAVRDQQSADAMADWTGRRPEVMPDTAADLARIWPAPVMTDRFAQIRDLLDIPDKRHVIALHVKERSLRGTSVADFANQLDTALEECDAVAVLVAIGRCHGDHDLVEAINRAAPRRTFAFQDADTLQDIAAVIAGSDAYLGASLHGHITAAAYGVPARLVAVPDLHKFSGQAVQLGRSDDVVTSWDIALKDLAHVLKLSKQPLPAAVASQLDAHWRDVAQIFAAGPHSPRHTDIFPDADIDTALAIAVTRARENSVTPDAPTSHQDAKQTGSDAARIIPTEWESKVVDGMIAEKRFDVADTLIVRQLDQNSAHLPARLAEVRLAIAQAQNAKAVDLAAKLARDWPENPWAWNAHMTSLTRAGHREDAIDLFLTGLDRPEIDETMLSGVTGALLGTMPAQEQISFLKAAIEKRPQSPHLMLRLAMRANVSGDYQLAIDMLKKVEKFQPLPSYAATVRSQLISLDVPMDEAVDWLHKKVEAGAQDTETLCRLCRLAAATGRFDLSVSSLRRALELHPQEWRSVYRLNRVFLPRAEDEVIFASLQRLANNTAPPPSWLLQYALFALRSGHENEGREALMRLVETDVAGPTARSLLAALDVLGTARPRPALLENNDVRIVQQKGAQGTILVFEGLIGGLSHIGTQHLDALLSDVPANVIYLRDPHGQFFLKGIPELGADEKSMQTALIRRTADLGAGKLVAIGGSASGYAALRTGLAIGADTVISLAGFVTPGAVDATEAEHVRRGMKEVFGANLDAFDLRPALRSNPGLQLTQVVGGSYAPDMTRLRAIDGIANARAIVLDGVDTHHVALPAVSDGTLKRLLNKALAV